LFVLFLQQKLTKQILKLDLNHFQTEMVDKCAHDGMVLPSIESFTLGSKLPKVHFLFYEHIYKAVIGKGNWK
jgi:hypothetical protein